MILRRELISARPHGGLYTAALLSALLEDAVDAIVVSTEVGVIEAFNPAAERMFGYTAEEAIGQNVRVLVSSPAREEHDSYLANYIRTGDAKVIGIGRAVTGRRKDGSTFPVHLALSDVRAGARRRFAAVLRDLSELHAAPKDSCSANSDSTR